MTSNSVAHLMWGDYNTGMSVQQVAKKWGCSEWTVHKHFRDIGVPLRPNNRNPWVIKAASFEDANRERSRLAAAERSAQAAAALPTCTRERWRMVLELRATHPEASLTELGLLMNPPASKDSVYGMLRRALEKAL